MEHKATYRKILSSLLALTLGLCEFAPFAAAEDNGEKSTDSTGLCITELMVKNHATRLDKSGNIADYIEIANFTDKPIELEGFGLSDKEDKVKWSFPAAELEPGEHLLIYADKNSGSRTQLHCGFALSHGETVYLTDRDGAVVDKADCSCNTADVALLRGEDGSFTESLYPSPAYPNSAQGYEDWQETLAHTSPLIISEAMSSNNSYLKQRLLGYCDWVEVKNVSKRPVELSDYYLSDDDDYLDMWRFPKRTLMPGECISVLCDDSELSENPGQLRAYFNLNSQRERIYLSHAESGLADSLFLRDIPYGCSYGRIYGEKGSFFFDSPSPNSDNEKGYRRVSTAPIALTADGVFEQGGVSVELEGVGKIYYTTDGSLPNAGSTRYKKPFTVEETSVVRAVCIEKGAMPSRALTLSYIIGEGHSLPVLSLVTDDAAAFRMMYTGKRKDMLVSGSLSLYEKDGSFTVPGGIEMHGETSLELPKKNMSFKLSGAFGQEEVEYDAFDGGVTRFSDFLIRSGQDYYETIVRNELLQNLCLEYSDSVPNQRSKHCVLYINGKYCGLYVLMEKLNEQHYANHMGVSPDSVMIYKTIAPEYTAFYREVIAFAHNNDLSRDENYEAFCEIVDIDSLIDWMIIEGYSVNSDIYDGNIRYCRSEEGDRKWRFMLYDLDSTMSNATNAFRNVLSPRSTQCAEFIIPLLKNAEFKDRFLSRAAQVLNSTLSDENVAAELDRLTDLVRPEVARDYARFGMEQENWEAMVTYLRSQIVDGQWSLSCQRALCNILLLTDSEKEHYFGF